MKFIQKKIIMNEKEVERTLKRLVHEIVEQSNRINDLVLIGIQTRGACLARRICLELKKVAKRTVPLGILDITLYRDDVESISHQPVVKETKIPFDVTGKEVVLIDDVLFTGRTIRAAIDEIIDFGRPKIIKLAVLIDKGGREIPIQPDFVGKRFPTSKEELIRVSLKEIDEKDNVVLKEMK
ncbi:MAG: bifunctional pyr operon transcriptional regulator/uracil phosphoribosyltransferase PyrR [Elusimicrobia bacterium]|nr:bifunctional pyr operon transcriptional regulator/uracil phosphoribosyltransferase PyrR [Elusimicrobiota bacterium]